jgi:hypothetical protein
MEFRSNKIFSDKGYPAIYLPEHEQANIQGRVYIHRLIMSEYLGRPLSSDEFVHHKDEDKWNWSIDNLELTNRSDHAKIHAKDCIEEKPCEYCGEIFKPLKNKTRFCKPECASLAKRRFIVTYDILKELVWIMPTTKIAESFGVSDKAVEKRCKLLGIEKPPRGYWAKNRDII